LLIGNSLNFPTFLKAKTPELLSAEMLKNNIKHRKEFNYFDIQVVGKEWYVWFVFDHSSTLKHTIRDEE
jgi:hypothetical protein